MEVSMRPCEEADHDTLFELHRDAMGEYIERTWGPWDDAVQHDFFRRRVEDGNMRVLEVDGEIAGILEVAAGADTVDIVNIELASRFHRRGIGTAILREIQQKARRSGTKVTLKVLRINPAQNLYRRLGFVLTGEDQTHLHMQWTPHVPPSPPRTRRAPAKAAPNAGDESGG